MSVEVRLGGVAVLATRAVQWSQTGGVNPYTVALEVPAEAAQAIYDAGVATTLKVDELEVRVRVLALEAGSIPATRRVRVADVRVDWPSVHVERRYNVPRKGGDRRLIQAAGQPIDTAAIVDDVAYEPATLNDGALWLAADVIADVVSAVTGAPFALGSAAAVANATAVYDLELSCSGDVAISRVLSYVGGLQITVDPDTTARVYVVSDGSEQATLDAATPPLAVGADLAVARHANERPSAVRVLFEREHELRFDAIDAEETGTSDLTRKLVNVVRVPDVTLTIGGRTVVQGTYVPLDDYLAAIAGSQPPPMPPLTVATLRQWIFKSPSFLEQAYARPGGSASAATWQRRIHEILTAWRRLYRIDPAYRGYLGALFARRAAVLDPETGTRAPATAYATYTRRPSTWSVAETSVADNPLIGWTVGAYNDDLKSAIAAPARVTIVDNDLGVIAVEPAPDPWGATEAMVPAVPATMPARSPATAKKNQAGEAILTWWQATAAANWYLAVVISARLGAPNDSSRLYGVTIDSPPSAGECKGPVLEVRIPAGVDTARFAWSDSAQQTVDNLIAHRRAGQDPRAFDAATKPYLSNAALVQGLAQATADRVYARLVDRVEGARYVPHTASARLTGSLSSVDHIVGEHDGGWVSLTRFVAGPPPALLSIWSYLPAWVDRQLRRIAT